MSQLALATTFQVAPSQLTKFVLQTSAGDYVLGGRTFGDGANSSGFAIRYDPGAFPPVLWAKTYSAPYAAFFSAMAQVGDGHFVATGTRFRSERAGDEDLWLVMLDADGNKIWDRTFGNPNGQNDGHAIAATADGGFIVAGLTLAADRPATLVLKFDRGRNLQWQRQIDGIVAFAVAQTRNGGYVLSGSNPRQGSLNSQVFILRLDANGNTIWGRAYPNYEVYVLLESGIAETSSGGFALVAKNVIMAVDSAGNPLWGLQATNLNLGSIVPMPDGTYAVGGSLIVDNYDYAYVAVVRVDPGALSVVWDNTEILKPSGIGGLLLNRDGFVTGAGYAPINAEQSLAFLAIFDPVKSLGPLARELEEATVSQTIG